MPVDLDKLPPLASRPGAPRLKWWLGLLIVLLSLGAAGVMVFASQPLSEQALSTWGLVTAGVLVSWCVLLAGRTVHYLAMQHAADGWDRAREQDRARMMSRGQRFVQVLDTSLHTGLRSKGQTMAAQLEALLRGEQAITTQPCWLGKIARHSRLPVEVDDTPTNTLMQTLQRVLAGLSETLLRFPDEVPLAVLLDFDSSLPESDIDTIWQQVWRGSGIRQTATALQGSGLGVLDNWLDLRSEDRSLLLVIACQIVPEPPAGTAEVAVGLLLGNPCGMLPRPAMAFVHRPQQAREATGQSWFDAVALSLKWAKQPSEAVAHAWRAGIAAQHETAMTTVLMGLPAELKRNTHNLDAMLGHPGAAAPWSAMAVAALAITQGAGVQVIFCGERVADSVFWSTVLSPAEPEI